jgi:hypothetical protein
MRRTAERVCDGKCGDLVELECDNRKVLLLVLHWHCTVNCDALCRMDWDGAEQSSQLATEEQKGPITCLIQL